MTVKRAFIEWLIKCDGKIERISSVIYAQRKGLSMKKIEVEKITEREKLIIRNGINTYSYIMNNREKDDEDFRDVYYNYYLTARSSVFSKMKIDKVSKQKICNPNWSIYYDLMKEASGEESLEEIVEYLKNNLTSKSFEFSFASKLLHTKNPCIPIYDSKVRKYLEDVFGKKFVSESGDKTLDKINDDWKMLNTWYNEFLRTDEAKNWIDWFDKEFPEGKGMTDIKKIDSIIFACTN